MKIFYPWQISGLERDKLLLTKIGKIMKLFTLFLFIATVQLSAKSYSQNINLSVSDITLKNAFRQIEKQTDYSFFVNKTLLKKGDKISATLKNATIDEAMVAFLKGLPITYSIIDKTIVLNPKIERQSSGGEMEEHLLEFPITGVVIDSASNEPLAGVTIKVKGEDIGTVTDGNGKFNLEVLSESSVLEVSFVGYSSVDVQVSGKSSIEISLSTVATGLDQLVVVGYGTQKKEDLTGAISTVGSDELNQISVADVNKALQGHSTGVLITQNNGEPGASSTIRIRGTGSINATNSPLYVVDGYPVSDISFINPSSVQSINILKDASATAIYGSRGSNGVVVITTKRGGSDGKLNISFDGYYGIQSVMHKIPLLNGEEYARFINEARINGGGGPYFDGSVNERPLPEAIGTGTDWQKAIFMDRPIQQYSLTLSSGTPNTKYSIIAGYYDQQGIIIGSEYRRYNLRVNLDQKISENIKVGLSSVASKRGEEKSRTATDGGSGGGVTNAAVNYPPFFPVLDSDGAYFKSSGSLNGSLVDNPVTIAKEVYNPTKGFDFLSNIYAEVEFLKGFEFRTSWGVNVMNNQSNTYFSRQTMLGAGEGGAATRSSAHSQNWLTENTIKYDKSFGKKAHNIKALLGYSYQKFASGSFTAGASGFNDDFALFYNLGAGNKIDIPTSKQSQRTLISYFARLNYSFNDRYLLTASIRRDGSSRFSENRKFGLFPSVAAAWRLKKEPFFSAIDFISSLKMRLSYGVTGNEGIGDFEYLSLISSAYYPLGNAFQTNIGGQPSNLANNNLSWEKNNEFDLGFDFGIFDERIHFTFDYYHRITSDLLFQVNIPSTTGYSNALQNVGRVKNSGLEMGLSLQVGTPDFKWTSDFNLTLNKNKILKLDGRPQFTTGGGSGHLVVNNTVLLEVGQPIGNFYGLKKIGIFESQEEVNKSSQPDASPGDIGYLDTNNDGKIDQDDRLVIGNGNPTVFGGFNNTFTHRGFELNIFLQGVTGNQILNFQRFDLYNLNGNNNQSIDVLNRWTPTNTQTTIPRANSRGGERTLSSFQVEDGKYLRLKNISLAYNITNKEITALKDTKVKIYISLQDCLTITDYKGYDPEVSHFDSDAISQGMDYGSYPSAKKILLGLKLTF